MKTTLESYGVAIIPAVVTDEECNQMLEGVWEFLSHITQTWPIPITRENPTSWPGIHELHLLRGAMFQQYSNGHSQYMWNLRQNPKVVEIFAHFWGVPAQDLLASFDGSNFTIPNNTKVVKSKAKNSTKKADFNQAPWYHLDQSLTVVG